MLAYRIDQASGIIEVTGLPVGAPDENANFVRTILADPAYRPDFGFLRDRRGLPALSIDEATRAASLSQRVPELRGKRWAIVVDDLVNYGTSRMQQTMAEWHGLDVQIFRDVESARKWLAEGPRPTADRA